MSTNVASRQSITFLGLVIIMMSVVVGQSQKGSQVGARETRLPEPASRSQTSVEEAMRERRSIRDFKKGEVLTLEEMSQLLWAAQGITHPDGLRTAPSAGALYPLEMHVVVGAVRNLSPGIYRYLPRSHSLVKEVDGDRRTDLARAALDQSAVRDAAAVILLSAIYERTTVKYGKRGERYVHFEIGHAAQNLALQAVSLDLGTVVVGAFSDDEVRKLAGLHENEQPLYLIPVGRK